MCPLTCSRAPAQGRRGNLDHVHHFTAVKQGDVTAFHVVCTPGDILVQQLQQKDQQNGMPSGEWLLPFS